MKQLVRSVVHVVANGEGLDIAGHHINNQGVEPFKQQGRQLLFHKREEVRGTDVHVSCVIYL